MVLSLGNDPAEPLESASGHGYPVLSLVSTPLARLATHRTNLEPPLFTRQVLQLGRPGDVLLIVTTEDSEDFQRAANAAKARNMFVAGIWSGKQPPFARACDATIQMPGAAGRSSRSQLRDLLDGVASRILGLEQSTPSSTDLPRPALPERIDLVVFDFDGVFTDNRVLTAQDGTESVLCDRRDSLGLEMLKAAGIPAFILTLETNPVVQARADKIGIEVVRGCHDKASFLSAYFRNHSIDPARVAYVGNDLNDLEAMRLVGFPVAPVDAHPDIIAVASVVLPRKGGEGAVRAFCELLKRHIEGQS